MVGKRRNSESPKRAWRVPLRGKLVAMSRTCCREDWLCELCFRQELLAKLRQARVIGRAWAEGICTGELRAQPIWPEQSAKTLTIARRLVGLLAKDPRLLDELAAACSAGAAEWWDRRPDQYRA